MLVDVDPQSHCAAGLGVPERRIEYSIGDAMLADLSGGLDRTRLVWEVARNLDLAPSTMRMAALEAPEGGLHAMQDKDRRLSEVLERLAPYYDRCLIDCPPNIGLLTFNALRAARETLIPVETGYFSLKGAEKQWETIQRVIKRIGRPIACHLLPTLHDPESDLARDILVSLRRQFAGQILPVVIRERHELRVAASVGQAVIEFAPDSAARRDHEALADWLEDHGVQPVVEIEILRSGTIEGVPSEDIGTEHLPRPAMPSAPPRIPLETGRAAELVRRLRKQTQPPPTPPAPPKSIPEAVAPMPRAVETSTATCEEKPEEIKNQPQVEEAVEKLPETNEGLRHLYGVRYTSEGVLFVQPISTGEEVRIAGDFNRWSPTAAEMKKNAELGVLEALIPIIKGTHHYRIVVDGEWHEDRYNEEKELNDFGEYNSVLRVPEGYAT